ncbi:conserved hypothetical protein [Candidatus Sulfobium mesophilum]|uniref:CsbD-like domain-containing protein n=1 Tax=Candidatus Sulfobium mesophilum TaxID=2016548 RepID=A0A2U3QHL6_9BACT|nr:conserved hypothetical protein [Candidatus Sulfobium mesophilum]
MNADILKGQWKEIKGEIKAQWGKLTDNDLTEIEGKEEELLGFLQKKYGYANDEAAQKYKNFMKGYNKPDAPP